MEIVEGMFLEPNHVCLMPPQVEMTAKDNQFMPQPPRKRSGWPITISIFMLSLAEACGQRSIAVILSGMDHDGVAALKAIKAAGGITFAQSDGELTTCRAMPSKRAMLITYWRLLKSRRR